MPGTALQRDAESCAPYIYMLDPAIQNVASMINAVIGELHNTNPRVTRFAQYIFGNNANQGLQAEFNDLAAAYQSNEIIIYCDQSRIALEDGEYVDNNHFQVIDGASVRDCQGLQASDNAIAAWTLEMDNDDLDNAVTVIQLCPWYLQQLWAGVLVQQPAYVTNAVVNAAYQLSISPPATPPPHPDIEGFSLLDQLILHELSHTPLGGEKEDVGPNNGYGWAAIRQLSLTDQGINNAGM
ncbi:hypothetical protein V8E54_000884 [Elaphomyces granulatus]